MFKAYILVCISTSLARTYKLLDKVQANVVEIKL